MTFKKPKDVRYTDMAIYIDTHVYSEDCDDNLVYEYIYHLINMLAHRASYFDREAIYDEFAIVSATHIYFRLKNPKQFQLLDNGQPRLPKVKSVLNYIKKTLYAMKATFDKGRIQDEECCDLQDIPETNTFDTDLSDYIDELQLSNFRLCLDDVVKTVKTYLQKIPYVSDKVLWQNIYLSCLFSFLNSVTLSNKSLRRLENLKNSSYSKPDVILQLYDEEKKDPVILFHLPQSMHSYITVLLNEVRHLISQDLSSTLTEQITPSVSVRNMILNTYEDET